MKFYIIHGPNINLLGLREPTIYGKENYEALVQFIKKQCDAKQIESVFFQSNHEGDLVDYIQAAYGDADGIIINPAAYTHTSVAILDALKAVGLPAVEVHLSNIYERESFRHHSYAGMACIKTYYGMGFDGYKEAIAYLNDYIKGQNTKKSET